MVENNHDGIELQKGKDTAPFIPYATTKDIFGTYTILRSIPDKFLGVIAMLGSIGVMAFLPWLDISPVGRLATGRGSRVFWLFVVA